MKFEKALKITDILSFGLVICATGLVIAFKFLSELIWVKVGFYTYALAFLSYAVFNVLKLIKIYKSEDEQVSKMIVIFTLLKIFISVFVLGFTIFMTQQV